MTNVKIVTVILICVLLVSAGEMFRRRLSSLPIAIQSKEKIQQSRFELNQENFPRAVIRDSILQEELQKIDHEDRPLKASKWIETSSWNHVPRRTDFGLKKARAPQYLWIDWFGIESAVSYKIFMSYSPHPFSGSKESYKVFATTKKTEYHSGDPLYLSGSRHQYQKNGYYRFKVAAVDFDKTTGPLSEYYELVLDNESALVAPGLSFNERHSRSSRTIKNR